MRLRFPLCTSSWGLHVVLVIGIETPSRSLGLRPDDLDGVSIPITITGFGVLAENPKSSVRLGMRLRFPNLTLDLGLSAVMLSELMTPS